MPGGAGGWTDGPAGVWDLLAPRISQVAEIAASLCASLYVEFEEQFQLPPLLNEKTPTTREIAGVLYACTSC